MPSSTLYPGYPGFPDEAFDMLKKASTLDPKDAVDIIDKIKKLQEQEKISVERKKMRNYSDVNIENTIQKIETYELELKHTRMLLEFLKTCKFKQGDVAFHKEYGNCLVQSVQVHNSNYRSGTTKVDALDPIFHVEYQIAVAKAVYRSSDSVTVKEQDLLPYGEMTNVLYKKGT